MSGSVINNIQKSFGVNGNRISTRRSSQDTSVVETYLSSENFSSPSCIVTNTNGNELLLVGTDKGKILFFESFLYPMLIDSITLAPTESIKLIATNGEFKAFISESSVLNNPPLLVYNYFDNLSNTISFSDEIIYQLALTQDSDGDYTSIILNSLNKFYLINVAKQEFTQFSLSSSEPIEKFGLTDLKQDGNNFIVINNGLKVEVYNFYGVLADNFPFTDPEGIGFVGTPLTADFEGDNNSEIISVTKDGRIFAIDGGTGKVVPGFPISIGGTVSITPVLYNANGKTNLAVLNDQNVLSVWSISSVEGKLYWSEEYGNPQNTSFIDAAENTNRINEFFPVSRAYNYPNPVYEGTTNIRYYVAEDSKINIKIFDLAGDFVAELNDEAQGGMDNETVWDVGDIQSGVYFARIEANSTSGKTEQAVIKIAIVK
jgi:hypothetical protein